MVLLILGGIAGVAVASVSGSATVPSLTIPTTTPPVHDSTTTTTSPARSGGPGGEALVAACVANVETLDAAVQAYEAVHGGPPPAGRTWSRGLVQSWPSSDQYALAWTGASVVVTPARGAPSSSGAGSESRRTGCYAA